MELLSRFQGVKLLGSDRAQALCPSHQDRNPSLSIKVADGGQTLLYCWAGCRTEDVLAAVGIHFSDLFPETLPSSLSKQAQRPPVHHPDRDGLAFRLKLHSDCLSIRAEATLNAASSFDCSAWTDEDFATAIGIVGRAYADLEQAERLRQTAFNLRQSNMDRKGTHLAA
jgi:hypothetical protein